MTDTEDIDAVAAEYVLGTLDAVERATVAARRQREPALNAAVTYWEKRLAPLNAAIAPVTPPSDLLARIEARIRGEDVAPAGSATIHHLRRSVRLWRTAALATSAIAAGLIFFVGMREFRPKPPSPNLVAVLQKDAASPAFLVTVNVEDRIMTVRPVAARRESGKSYELWIVHDSLGGPKSLGTIDDPGAMVRPTLAAYSENVIEQATYAVSLEPEGGSPSGAPTGPVLFAGKLIAPK